MNVYLAADFGAGSGRVIAGHLGAGGRLVMEELHRFPNPQVRVGRHLHWDILSMWSNLKEGIAKAVDKGMHIVSIGIDTWGVDFGLLDRNGDMLGMPYCYRDPHTDGVIDSFSPTPEARLRQFIRSGIQPVYFNTIYQLLAMKRDGSPLFEVAKTLLFMPDLLSYFLTGCINVEYTIASTSELLYAGTPRWNRELIAELGLPADIWPEIVMPGSVRGQLRADVASELGIDYPVSVIAVGSHDTASAVYAVPAPSDGGVRAFLSSGTWSLLGVELDSPVIGPEALEQGYSNEGSVSGGVKMLQNIPGLWILQQLMKQWERRGLCVDFDYLLPEAEKSVISTVIDVDDRSLVNPSDMEQAVSALCTASRQPVPSTQGEMVRVVLQSLASRYKVAVDSLNRLLPSPVTSLHIVGGGCRNKLLNRLTQEALGVPVNAGPVEATAIGNLLVQAVAVGDLKTKNEACYI